jgi:hypothetical protein
MTIAKVKIFEYRRVRVEDSEIGLKGYIKAIEKEGILRTIYILGLIITLACDRYSF